MTDNPCISIGDGSLRVLHFNSTITERGSFFSTNSTQDGGISSSPIKYDVIIQPFCDVRPLNLGSTIAQTTTRTLLEYILHYVHVTLQLAADVNVEIYECFGGGAGFSVKCFVHFNIFNFMFHVTVVDKYHHFI